ncbi:MAG: hypothetical protein AB8I08_20800 [Sandaracinaceae bacterium]
MRRAKKAGTVALVLAATLALSVTAAAAPVARPSEPEPGSEHWRITGAPSADGCGGRIVLVVQHLRFTASTMFGDVVNRLYQYERRGDLRVAEGQFDADFACAGTQLYERWELRQRGPDVLVGELSSTWHLEPSCEPCTIRFRIRAERMR